MPDEVKTISALVDIIKEAIYELRGWGSIESQAEFRENTLDVLSAYPELRDAFSEATEEDPWEEGETIF